jgi:hypothetical protein
MCSHVLLGRHANTAARSANSATPDTAVFFLQNIGHYRRSTTAQKACEAGYSCPGDCVRNACAPGTFQSGTSATSCVAW